MLVLTAWLHDLDPFAIRLGGGFGLRWYGLSYAAGFLCAWLALRWMSKKGLTPLSKESVTDLVFAAIFGVVIGGRLGYIAFYQPALLVGFSSSPPWWDALAINKGGMASHGGMLGLVVACLLFARRKSVPPLHAMDVVCLSAPFGLFFGRLANFVNGELLGKVVAAPGQTAPWWAVRYPQELLTTHAPELDPEQQAALTELLLERVREGEETVRPAIERLIADVQAHAPDVAARVEPLISARHPSQLYQALAEGVVVCAILWVMWRKPRRAGFIGAWFLVVYGALRIATEFVRLPDDHLGAQRVAGLTRGQLLSALMVLIGAAFLVAIARRKDAPRFGGWSKKNR